MMSYQRGSSFLAMVAAMSLLFVGVSLAQDPPTSKANENAATVQAKNKDGDPETGDFDGKDFGEAGVGTVSASSTRKGDSASARITVTKTPKKEPVISGSTSASSNDGGLTESDLDIDISAPADPAHNSASSSGPTGGKGSGAGTANSSFGGKKSESTSKGHGFSTASTSQSGGMTTAVKTVRKGGTATAKASDKTSSTETSKPPLADAGKDSFGITVCLFLATNANWTSFTISLSVRGRTERCTFNNDLPGVLPLELAFSNAMAQMLEKLTLLPDIDYVVQPPGPSGKYRIVFQSSPVAFSFTGWANSTGGAGTTAVTVLCE